MRKYDRIMLISLLTYLVMTLFLAVIGQGGNEREDMSYKVEINQIMQGLEDAGAFSEPDLHDMKYVEAVSFLPEEAVYGRQTEPEADVESTVGTESETNTESMAGTELEANAESMIGTESKSEKESDVKLTQEQMCSVLDFFQNHNRINSTVYPLIIENRLTGYVRFDYTTEMKRNRILWLAEGVLSVSYLAIFAVLWYIRQRIIKPFHVISEMPYELAKGNLQVDTEENRGRFFGKFIWGIAMLRDTLNLSREKALRLEKEKKLLLLSISHDIKIPLSAIKLYAKALREDVYKTAEQQMYAASQIESHAQEIERFVKEIVSSASEDILEIEVVNAEFYLKDYINRIKGIYEPKCRLAMTEFMIGKYENKLLKGDIDRAAEVMENLLENAMKYGDGRRIRIDFYEEDYCQVIEVSNTGEKVTQKEMPHLFDSFYRGSNAQHIGGNGLGLYISRQIMLKMDGDIFAKRTETGMSFGLVFNM